MCIFEFKLLCVPQQNPLLDFLPEADSCTVAKGVLYSINSPARSSNCGGMVRPKAFAVSGLHKSVQTVANPNLKAGTAANFCIT